MIKIITDSTAYIPEDYAKENEIEIIPLRYLIADKEYVEGFPSSFDKAFEIIEASGEIPKTSQPSVTLFTDAYEKIIANGDEAIVITIASSLSGTNSVATLAKNSCSAPDKITIIDSGSTGPSIWGLIMEMIEDIKNGKTREEIIKHVEDLKVNSEIYFCPDSFENLKKGGRIGTITAVLGSLLKIKPLLSFKNGILTCPKKIIGSMRAIADLIERVPKNAKRIFIIKIYQSKFFQTLIDLVNQKFPKTNKVIADFGPVVGAHIGHAIGLSWICEKC